MTHMACKSYIFNLDMVKIMSFTVTVNLELSELDQTEVLVCYLCSNQIVLRCLVIKIWCMLENIHKI